MSSSAHLGKTQWILAALCVLVVAFIGATAGKWFAEWRQDRALREKLEKLYSSNPAKLNVGDAFPQLELLDLDENVIDTKTVIDGRMALVFFLAPTCDMCSELIEAYREHMDRLPPELNTFAICPDTPPMARFYADEHGLPFSLYCDTAQSFQFDHGVIAFPTLMALDENGVIKYVNFGMMEDYALEDILQELARF
ncbi:MAG: redoxin family protein [Candidatus Zixiibacteriota bacterium]|nr:MAG: redoxin family protein [candidate division Zixibacteria bacterium]